MRVLICLFLLTNMAWAITAEEIEYQLRLDNPMTRIDGNVYVSGDAEYEALMNEWVVNGLANYQENQVIEARSAMANSFKSLPAQVRGQFRPIYDSATRLMDEKDFEAAYWLVYGTQVSDELQQVKVGFVNAIIAIIGSTPQ